NACHGARLEIGGIAHGGLDFGAAGDALSRFEAECAELRSKGVESGAAETAEREGRGDIDHTRLTGHGGGRSRNAAGEVALIEGDCGAAGEGGGGWRRGGRGRGGIAHHGLD